MPSTGYSFGLLVFLLRFAVLHKKLGKNYKEQTQILAVVQSECRDAVTAVEETSPYLKLHQLFLLPNEKQPQCNL